MYGEKVERIVVESMTYQEVRNSCTKEASFTSAPFSPLVLSFVARSSSSFAPLGFGVQHYGIAVWNGAFTPVFGC